ncbi:MAG: hypothetical protein JXR76_14795 [Deltaproteobacteria bacterium]|nr:hypothetical protein [Deltaproteobacteria bacterium]
MAKQYTLSTFLRQTPNELLETYFRQRNLLDDIEFTNLRKREVDSVIAAIETLSEEERVPIDIDFQDVYILANKTGTIIIQDVADFHELGIEDQLEAMENHYHRAMWVFLHRDFNGIDIFDRCVNLANLKKMAFTRSKRCNGLPNEAPSSDDATLKDMGEALTQLYRQQGRGHKCKVEYCPRPNPMRHCYFAFPEDYSASELQYDGDKLERKSRKSVFEIGFIFRPQDGVLEISTSGNKQEAEALQDIFCRIALDLSGVPEKSREPQYNFEKLKNRDCVFPTRPEDGIAKVEVLGLRVNKHGNLKRRVTVEQDPGSGESVYEWVDKTLDAQKMSMDKLDISQVKMRFTWRAINGKRPRTLTFSLTNPDGTSLGDLPSHQIVKGYLKEWNIML